MGYPGTDPLLVAAAARGEEQALDRLVDEMHYFHRALPGVLGAWYFEQGEEIFEGITA